MSATPSAHEGPSSRGHRVVRGAVAGVIGTAIMSGVLALGRLAGARGEAPPRKLTRLALRTMGLRTRGRPLDAMAVLAHVAFGASVGAAYELMLGRQGAPPAKGALRGAAYGLGVWAVNYAAWIPAAGIMPRPWRDRTLRPATMVAGHIAYGVTLGALCSLLR